MNATRLSHSNYCSPFLYCMDCLSLMFTVCAITMFSSECVIEQLRHELNQQRNVNVALTKHVSSLTSKLESLECTVRRFHCVRLLPHAPFNVSCEISIRNRANAQRGGVDMVLVVRDVRTNDRLNLIPSTPHPNSNNGTAPPVPMHHADVTPTNTPSSVPALDDIGEEYVQPLSTVQCRALDIDDAATTIGDAAENGMTVVGADLSLSSEDGVNVRDDDLPSPSNLTGRSPGLIDPIDPNSLHSPHGHSSLLDLRPRFLLWFTADRGRVLMFESEKETFRKEILMILKEHVRMAQALEMVKDERK